MLEHLRVMLGKNRNQEVCRKIGKKEKRLHAPEFSIGLFSFFGLLGLLCKLLAHVRLSCLFASHSKLVKPLYYSLRFSFGAGST